MGRHVSIHALLAESDLSNHQSVNYTLVSIHALLAESDVNTADQEARKRLVSIHALLAESDQLYINRTAKAIVFLSTLSLRRATINGLRHKCANFCFYPRSPCGERP